MKKQMSVTIDVPLSVLKHNKFFKEYYHVNTGKRLTIKDIASSPKAMNHVKKSLCTILQDTITDGDCLSLDRLIGGKFMEQYAATDEGKLQLFCCGDYVTLNNLLKKTNVYKRIDLFTFEHINCQHHYDR